MWRVGLLARSHTHTHVYTASSSRRDATTTLYARSQELRRLSRSSSPPKVRCNQREELRTHSRAHTQPSNNNSSSSSGGGGGEGGRETDNERDEAAEASLPPPLPQALQHHGAVRRADDADLFSLLCSSSAPYSRAVLWTLRFSPVRPAGPLTLPWRLLLFYCTPCNLSARSRCLSALRHACCATRKLERRCGLPADTDAAEGRQQHGGSGSEAGASSSRSDAPPIDRSTRVRERNKAKKATAEQQQQLARHRCREVSSVSLLPRCCVCACLVPELCHSGPHTPAHHGRTLRH